MGRGEELLFNKGTEFQLEMDVADNVNVLNATKLHTLKMVNFMLCIFYHSEK